MTTLKYTVVGKETVSINFACAEDAAVIADSLIELSGIVNVLIQEDRCAPRIVKRPGRYVVEYRNRYGAHNRQAFQYLQDAVRFGEDQIGYVVVDMFEDRTYQPEDVRCLLG